MAAGQGFKTFVTGEVLTAADTNGYLMQGVNVFANAAARTAAITSPQEGQMSYLSDTNSTEYYSGSAWAVVGGGGMTLLSTTTLSGGSTSLGTIPSGYVDLRLYILNYKPSTDGANMQWRYNSDSGNSYKVRSANESGVSGFTTTMGMVYGNDNSVAVGLGAMTIYNYSNATTWKTSEWLNVTVNSTTTTTYDQDKSYGFWNGTAAITNITFYPSGGTFTSGTVLLYGVK